METARECGREGCGKRLISSNKSGFCTQHFYDSKRSSDATPKPRKQRKFSGSSDPTQDVSMPVTLKLSEEGLNRLLLGLPRESKAKLLQQFLVAQ